MNTYPVRLSIKAIIIENENLLCIKHNENGDVYYTLPGGGQEFGETVTDALRRECLEEAQVHVIPQSVVFIRDYIGKNHEFAYKSSDFHQVEIFMRCTIDPSSVVKIGAHPDHNQVGVEWKSMQMLETLELFPKVLRHRIAEYHKGNTRCEYLGDVN